MVTSSSDQKQIVPVRSPRKQLGHRQSPGEAKISILAGSCLLLTTINIVPDIPLSVKVTTFPVFAALTKLVYPSHSVSNAAMDVILSSMMLSNVVPWQCKFVWASGYLLVIGKPPHRWGTAVVLACLMMSYDDEIADPQSRYGNGAENQVSSKLWLGEREAIVQILGSPRMPWQVKLAANVAYTLVSLIQDGYFASFPAMGLSVLLLTQTKVPLWCRMGSAVGHLTLAILSVLFSEKFY